MASWPAVIPEISVVPPSLRMFPVMVDSNKLMVSFVQDGDPGARQRHNLVAHQVDVHALGAVRQHVLEGEAREVARPRADSAQRVLGDALRGEGGDEFGVGVELVHDAHVLDLGVVGAAHDLQEVVELRRAGDGVPGVLQGSQLHLALQVEGVRGRPWVLQVAALAQGVRGLPEGHEGAHELRVGPRDRHVVAGDASGHVGDLGVHRRVGEDKAAAREQHLVEGLHQGAVQRHLGGQHPDALDAEVGGAAGRAQRVPGLRDQVQLRGQHLPTLEEPDQGRAHEDVPVLAGGDLDGVAPEVLPEALEAPLVIPFLRLQQRVQEAAPPVLGDVIGALAVGVELDPLDEAAGLDGAREEALGGVVVPDPEGDLDALRVDEIHAAGQRDARHPGGGGREGTQRGWEILYVTPRLHIIDVGRRELVVQALHKLIVHRLRDVLHRAWLSPIAVRQVRGHPSAGRTRAPRWTACAASRAARR